MYSTRTCIFLILKMVTTIRSFADLHLLKDALTDIRASGESITTVAKLLPVQAKVPTHIPELAPLPNEDATALAELEALLKQYKFWLGYSPIKGWVLLDRKHPEYSQWSRPFILLRDGCVDRLSREEFSKEPQGPWGLDFWNLIDDETKRLAGPASALLPEVQRYLQEVARAAQQVRLADGDLATRIGNPPFNHGLYFTSGLEFQEKWAGAKREHYATALPARICWLSRWAKQIHGGATGLEPMWSKGIAAADHLHQHGIDYLWHLTDVRNLKSIRREGGLVSWAGLSALGVTGAHMVANAISRSCDERLGRERYVRLSFIPNSWFFHRVRGQRELVWLRFSMQALALGEVSYSFGNAASGFIVLHDNLQSMGMNWKMVKPFSDQHTDEKGPTLYQSLHQNQVGDPALFRQISNAWNSEILIKHFLPFVFCTGVFDSQTGESIQIQ